LFAQDLQQTFQQMFTSFNWLSFLRPTLLGVPGLMDGTQTVLPDGLGSIEWQVGSPLALLFAIVLMTVIGIGLGGLYWSLIARQARDERIDWGAAVGRMTLIWPRLIGLALFILGLLLGIWLAAVLISAILGGALGFIGALVVMLALSSMIWVLFYVTFGLHGIVLYNQRVLDAVRASFQLGRRHFWSVFGMIVAAFAVELGLGLIWRLVPLDSWLWAVSIVADAFVVAGVSMATMLFYMDRVTIPSSAVLA
jgi:hypothetical protein